MAYLRGLWAFHGQLFVKETFGALLNVSKMIHPRGITGIMAGGGVTPSSYEKTKRRHMDTRKEFDRLRNKGVLARECGTVCVCCGAMEGIDYHHILPLVLGGDNRYSNIVPICASCHGKIHGADMTCLTRYAQKTGRPRDDAPAEYREAFTRYITGRWQGKDVKRVLGLSSGARISELWYYKEFLEKNGIERVEKKGGKGNKASTIYFHDGCVEEYINGELV